MVDDGGMATSARRFRPRAPWIVGVAALAVIALVVGGVLVWRARADGGRAEAEAFEEALDSGDFSGVPLTGSTAEEAAAIREHVTASVVAATGVEPTVALTDAGEVEDGDRTATYTWTWDLPEPMGTWTYETTATFSGDDGTWSATMLPNVVYPGLDDDSGSLDVEITRGTAGSVTDRDGNILVTPTDVIDVGLDLSQIAGNEDAAGTARELAGLLGIDADSYEQKVTDAQAAGQTASIVPALTIRASAKGQYPLDKAAALPGYSAVEGTLPLTADRSYASGVLGTFREATATDAEESGGEIVEGELISSGGVTAARRDQIVGTEGLQIIARGFNGSSEVVKESEPTDGTDVQITLDPDLQEAATAAVAGQDSPSAVIAMSASTGQVLATGLGPSGQSYPVGLVGQYAPGSTFKMATALALLRTGDTPDTQVDCPATASVDGRSYKNADSFESDLVGSMSLAEAIAHSCNTAMVLQSGNVSQDALVDAATTLGIGQDAPEGLDAFMGSVDPEDTGSEHTADLIGQGKVLASPLAMATALASISSGSTVHPRILMDDDAAAADVPTPLTEQEAADMRAMLARTVTDGTLTSQLGDLSGGEVIGKTGTAEWTDASGEAKLHSWVVAAQGDVVVCAFVEDGGYGATTAGPLVRQVLEAAQSAGLE